MANPESAMYFVHSDHLGTPTLLSGEASTVVWAADSEPFGKVSLQRAAVSNRVRFPGQYYDSETALHYNYFRDYDPTIGRYTQSDPIGLAGGSSTYSYVGGNPTRYWDRSGLEGFPSDFIDIDSTRATPGDIGRGIVGTFLPVAPIGVAAAFSGSTVLGLSAISIGSTAVVYVADPRGDNAARGAMDLIAFGAAWLDPAVAGGMATINLTFDLLSLSPDLLNCPEDPFPLFPDDVPVQPVLSCREDPLCLGPRP